MSRRQMLNSDMYHRFASTRVYVCVCVFCVYMSAYAHNPVTKFIVEFTRIVQSYSLVRYNDKGKTNKTTIQLIGCRWRALIHKV